MCVEPVISYIPHLSYIIKCCLHHMFNLKQLKLGCYVPIINIAVL
jgi:hypothetical protein